jgi:hypothetical protein
MPTIDVSAEIDIDAAPADIAGVMFDPQREPEWISVITGVELLDPELAPGARVRRTGSVLGRSVGWTTEVERVHFPHLLILKVVDAPFRASTRFEVQRSGTGSRVRVRGVGDADTLPVPAAFVEGPLKSALAAGLARLKTLVESTARLQAGGPTSSASPPTPWHENE